MTPSRKVHPLLVAVAGGDARAFEELYRLSSPKLYGLVLRVLRQQELAGSAMRRAFARIGAEAATASPREDPLAFLVARARAATLDMARARPGLNAWDPFEVEAPAADPLALPARSAPLTRLLACLGTLPEERRRMLLLAYYDGWGEEAISVVFDAPAAVVRTMLARSTDQIADCIAGQKPTAKQGALADLDRHLAAEYALGTLPGPERAALAARLDGHPELAATVRRWERRLAPLHELAAPVAPPPELGRLIAADFAADLRARRRNGGRGPQARPAKAAGGPSVASPARTGSPAAAPGAPAAANTRASPPGAEPLPDAKVPGLLARMLGRGSRGDARAASGGRRGRQAPGASRTGASAGGPAAALAVQAALPFAPPPSGPAVAAPHLADAAHRPSAERTGPALPQAPPEMRPVVPLQPAPADPGAGSAGAKRAKRPGDQPAPRPERQDAPAAPARGPLKPRPASPPPLNPDARLAAFRSLAEAIDLRIGNLPILHADAAPAEDGAETDPAAEGTATPAFSDAMHDAASTATMPDAEAELVAWKGDVGAPATAKASPGDDSRTPAVLEAGADPGSTAAAGADAPAPALPAAAAVAVSVVSDPPPAETPGLPLGAGRNAAADATASAADDAAAPSTPPPSVATVEAGGEATSEPAVYAAAPLPGTGAASAASGLGPAVAVPTPAPTAAADTDADASPVQRPADAVTSPAASAPGPIPVSRPAPVMPGPAATAAPAGDAGATAEASSVHRPAEAVTLPAASASDLAPVSWPAPPAPGSAAMAAPAGVPAATAEAPSVHRPAEAFTPPAASASEPAPVSSPTPLPPEPEATPAPAGAPSATAEASSVHRPAEAFTPPAASASELAPLSPPTPLPSGPAATAAPAGAPAATAAASSAHRPAEALTLPAASAAPAAAVSPAASPPPAPAAVARAKFDAGEGAGANYVPALAGSGSIAQASNAALAPPSGQGAAPATVSAGDAPAAVSLPAAPRPSRAKKSRPHGDAGEGGADPVPASSVGGAAVSGQVGGGSAAQAAAAGGGVSVPARPPRAKKPPADGDAENQGAPVPTASGASGGAPGTGASGAPPQPPAAASPDPAAASGPAAGKAISTPQSAAGPALPLPVAASHAAPPADGASLDERPIAAQRPATPESPAADEPPGVAAAAMAGARGMGPPVPADREALAPQPPDAGQSLPPPVFRTTSATARGGAADPSCGIRSDGRVPPGVRLARAIRERVGARAVAASLAVAMVGLAATFAYREWTAPRGVAWMALLQPGPAPAVVARLDPATGALKVKVLAPQPPAGTRLALWLVTPNGGSHLLARFVGDVDVTVPAVRRIDRATLAASTLEISMEAAEAAAGGVASVPQVVYRGRLIAD